MNYRIPNKKLLFVLALFLASNLTAQSFEQTKDSLLNLLSAAKHDTTKAKLYAELSFLYVNASPEVSKKYALKTLKYSKKAGHKGLEKEGYSRLFRYHLTIGAPSDTLFFYTNLVEKVAKAMGSEREMTEVYWYRALSHSNIKQTDKELEFYLKALQNFRKYGGKSGTEASLLNNIGLLYVDSKPRKALTYIKEASESAEGAVNKGNMFYNIATLYLRSLNEIDSALIFYQKATVQYEKINDLISIATIKILEARCYQKQGKRKTSQKKLQEALILAAKIGTAVREVEQELMLFYEEQGQLEKVIYYGERTLQLMKQENDFYEIENVYETLHLTHAKLGGFPRAYELLKELDEFKDSTANVELLSKVETLTTEFEVKQKETENKLLKAEKATAEKTLRSRNATLLAMFFGLIFLGGWAFFIYRANQQKKKYNEILEQKVAERTAELENANKNLEQANYELRTFNYIASHDIKEPIRNVGNYAGLIFRKLPQDLKTDLQDYFDIIKRSTAQLYTLVEDFARYTTLSKNDKIELQKVDLNDLIGSVATDLTETIKKYGGQVVSSPLPIIESNNSLLYPAFKNLIENGLKYNQSETPTVQVWHSETDTHHEIHIKDNGIGIEPQYHAQIFEMFKRLHDRSKYEGSGIGLAITKLTVKKLGGDILLESAAQKGSDFVVRLPKILT